MNAAHKIRDAAYNKLPGVIDTGELYDVIIVGGGLTGLGAAYFIHEETGGTKKCLVLENHAVFGGECRQNEFVVNGRRLIGPQGSNDFGLPRGGSSVGDQLYTACEFPASSVTSPGMHASSRCGFLATTTQTWTVSTRPRWMSAISSISEAALPTHVGTQCLGFGFRGYAFLRGNQARLTALANGRWSVARRQNSG